jgi:hypothetical protein
MCPPACFARRLGHEQAVRRTTSECSGAAKPIISSRRIILISEQRVQTVQEVDLTSTHVARRRLHNFPAYVGQQPASLRGTVVLAAKQTSESCWPADSDIFPNRMQMHITRIISSCQARQGPQSAVNQG